MAKSKRQPAIPLPEFEFQISPSFLFFGFLAVSGGMALEFWDCRLWMSAAIKYKRPGGP
jgi:hypothetical protein